MLIRFEVSNFRSIHHPVELSMVAVDDDRREARHVPNLNLSLLPVAAVYGPNASGKSNVLAAMGWLRDAVRDSLRFWDDGIPLQPFAFAESEATTSEFTIESAIDGVRFEYIVELDAKAVQYEALFHYPEKKRRRLFEREGTALTLQRGLGSLSGTRELLTERTLALSIARRFEEPLVSGFSRELLGGETLGNQSLIRRPSHYPNWTRHWLDLPITAERAEALAMLRMADLGIDDVMIDQHVGDDGSESRKVSLVHRTAKGRVPLDFADESEGTRTWFTMIGPILTTLRTGTLVIFDELDASLHPTLSSQLIRLFHDPTTNPLGAQLIFSSHDTSLLNHLNRDEVWLTEKLEDGATRLGALAEFAGERVRKSQNLEKAYLHGRFGALPDVDRTEMLRALGLIG
ncbi:AAA family ATPase [Actinophytocola sp.]|uniref:AAA family ATPase n=1 Tax=Actinophytocola sp. TaxID=1872138 RepID=UPI003899D96D